MRFRPSTSESAPAGNLIEDAREGGRRDDQADQLRGGPEVLGEAGEDRAPGHLIPGAGQEARQDQGQERRHGGSLRTAELGPDRRADPGELRPGRACVFEPPVTAA